MNTVGDLINFLRDKNPSAKVVISIPSNGREVYIIEKELQEMTIGSTFADLTTVTLVPVVKEIWPMGSIPKIPNSTHKLKSGVTTKGG